MGFWDDAQKSESKSFKPFVKGKYYCQLTNATVDVEKLSIQFEFTVTGESDYVNRKLWRTYRLNDPVGKGYFLDDLSQFGIVEPRVNEIGDLGPIVTPLIGKSLEVYVQPKPKKDSPGEFYNNAYINEVFNPIESEAPAALDDDVSAKDLKNHAPTFDQKEEVPF